MRDRVKECKIVKERNRGREREGDRERRRRETAGGADSRPHSHTSDEGEMVTERVRMSVRWNVPDDQNQTDSSSGKSAG